MSIERADIKYYKSATYNDSASNGGRRSNTQITSGSSNQLFPVITSAERAAGSAKFRKIFAQLESVQSLPLIDAKVYLENPTPAQDMVFFFPASKTDVQSSITGSERVYGCGYLNSAAAIGATSITVQVEDGAVEIFKDGDLIRISNKSNIDDVTANTTEEYAVISGAPDILGNLVTLTLASGLVYGYSSTNSRVCSVYQAGTIELDYDSLVVSSSSGAYNSVDNPITLLAKSTIDQTWTISFTSATQATVSGDTIGSLGTVSLTTDIAPTNPTYSAAYFRLPIAGLSGTWAAGDSITFKTYSQSIPLWFKRIVPAGTQSFTGNKFVVVVEGESE
jgi:hypothetical protein